MGHGVGCDGMRWDNPELDPDRAKKQTAKRQGGEERRGVERRGEGGGIVPTEYLP